MKQGSAELQYRGLLGIQFIPKGPDTPPWGNRMFADGAFPFFGDMSGYSHSSMILFFVAPPGTVGRGRREIEPHFRLPDGPVPQLLPVTTPSTFGDTIVNRKYPHGRRWK